LLRSWMLALPLLDHVLDVRAIGVAQLALAVLAAFGLEAALAGRGLARTAVLASAAVLAAAGVAALTVLPAGHDAGTVGEGLLGRGRLPAVLLPAASVVWCLVFAGGALLALLGLRRGVLGAAVALLVAADLLRFGHGYQPVVPAVELTRPAPPAVAYL